MRRWLIPMLAVAAAGALAGLAPAWWVKGHESITEAAAARLPDDVPAFFRAGGKHLAHFAGDPDRWKNRECRALRASVEADHYLDLEDLNGKPLPPEGRFKGMELMRSLGKDPVRVGMLPYAIVEGYERLACAFYDHRQNPADEAVKMKCLVYAGNLAHYTTDAAMPLHTTIHFDGRIQPDGSKTQKGIHAKVDAFPEKFKLSPEEIARGLESKPIDNVWDHVAEFIRESHTHVNRCYELDAAGAFDAPTEASRAFILARCRAGAQLTMDLWLAAWKKSETLPPLRGCRNSPVNCRLAASPSPRGCTRPAAGRTPPPIGRPTPGSARTASSGTARTTRTRSRPRRTATVGWPHAGCESAGSSAASAGSPGSRGRRDRPNPSRRSSKYECGSCIIAGRSRGAQPGGGPWSVRSFSAGWAGSGGASSTTCGRRGCRSPSCRYTTRPTRGWPASTS